MASKPEIEVTPSSGNVFADLGLADPEEELARAQLASRIQQITKRRRLTQVAAAKLMGIRRKSRRFSTGACQVSRAPA